MTRITINKWNTKELFLGKIKFVLNFLFFFTKAAFTENQFYRHPAPFVKMGRIDCQFCPISDYCMTGFIHIWTSQIPGLSRTFQCQIQGPFQ